MAADWLLMTHFCYEPGAKPSPDTVLDWLFQQGFHTEKNGGSDTCHYYAVDSDMDFPASDVPTDQAIERLHSSEGFLRLWKDDIEFYYQNWEYLGGVPDLPYYTLKFPAGQLRSSEIATQIVDIVGEFADETRPVYGFGHEGAGERESHRQHARRLLDGHLNKLFWLNYLSKRFVDTFGRDRLLSAPAERVEERTHGAILLVPYVVHRRAASSEQATKLRKIEKHLGIPS